MENTNKPIVHYTNEAEFILYVDSMNVERELAYVRTIDHPYLGARDVRTSYVINKYDDGSFETCNTIYQRSDMVNKEEE